MAELCQGNFWNTQHPGGKKLQQFQQFHFVLFARKLAMKESEPEVSLSQCMNGHDTFVTFHTVAVPIALVLCMDST